MDTSTDFLEISGLWDMGYQGGFNFVPHVGSTYARPRDDDDPYETSPSDRGEGQSEFNPDGSSFYTSHGTHVAGTIAAIGANDYDIKGIAPQVDLYAYRVLGAYGSGQFSWILAGIDKSVEEEMDIINLSLGGGNNDATTVEAAAINNATLAGVTPVLATGNSGPNRETIGQPAVAPLGIAVGNSTLPETTYTTSMAVEAGDYNAAYEAGLMGWTFASKPADTLTGTFDVVAVPNVGSASDYDGLDVAGKVALVSRGEIPFVEKIAAAKNMGAVGIVIHNNVPNAGPSGFLQGPGRVQPMKAAIAEALAYSLGTLEQDGTNIDHKTGTIGFGVVLPDQNDAVSVTRQIEVRNLTGNPSNYEVSIQTTKKPTEELAGVSVAVDKTSFTLTDREVVTVTLTVPAGNSTTENELLGYIKLTNGTTNLSLPFAADFSAKIQTGLEYLTLDDEAISPNGDGEFETTTLRYRLYDYQLNTIFEIFDLNDPSGGYYNDGFIGYLDLKGIG